MTSQKQKQTADVAVETKTLMTLSPKQKHRADVAVEIQTLQR